MLFWKDVGNGILLYRPLPFKSHQGYQPLPCFIPAVGSCEKQCGDDGDDLITAVASHYRGEAVMRLSSQPYLTYMNHLYVKQDLNKVTTVKKTFNERKHFDDFRCSSSAVFTNHCLEILWGDYYLVKWFKKYHYFTLLLIQFYLHKSIFTSEISIIVAVEIIYF